ncbi:hypothetical protein [Bacillus sp. AFS088145]|uniref:hypothetical protein n=1 Tax=Bacillus sp. AFS088145 TaxID=2033514 RepID=UPI000BF6CEBF|nr:hypothetical protein [Bacillus sp. AFS088145]PFH81616.1 hypothetical protein COI44_22840 [Bacillus sp. AFS088145]
MAQQKAKVKIRGIRPLLIHAFSPDTISLERKAKTGVAGNDPEEWKKSYNALKTGQLWVDPSYIFGTLRTAAVHTKSGRGSIQSKFSATLQVIDDKILFNRFMPEDLNQFLENTPEDEVYLDVRSVRNPATKGRNVRYRVAMSPGWETEFTLQWDNTIIAGAQVEQVLLDGGSLVGLADGRSIGFGRFELVSFEELSLTHA